MESLAYLQVTQEHENLEDKELTLEALNAIRMSGKVTGTLLGVAGAAIAVGVATDAPAQAHGYSHDYGCGDYCGPTFVGGGYLVTSYQTYDVSFKSYKDNCYDHYCGGGYPVSHGCYDYCGVSYPKHDSCYDYCKDDYYPVSYDYGYGHGYGGGCGDYCGGGYPVSYGYDYGYGGGYGGCDDYCGVSYGYSTYDIQVALNYAGFHVAVDGVFGPETQGAVVAFQHAVGLVPDGIVGPATASALGLY
ncbi:peptidoglycan-binding domain-containing protein [Leptolyngbya sp. 7M]|uniref:peptidoglycan-binding domain-containing protein n=1 Tax=Leptolyngbya sp. 7M TaxID=2812896 RepID=UPI001B8AAC94|nr:peptidoglycan-binding domain-containing protein [Leptolyngbya sp. 7M]QYO68177.1 peptidoglycan-binding protein [Leptolyngbya sp. 7M]